MRRLKKAGERPAWSHRDPEKKPFPFEAPFHPAEIAHEVFQAWLTFAAARRRPPRRTSASRPTSTAASIGELLAPMTEVAATNPYAWFPLRALGRRARRPRRREPHGRLPVHEVHRVGDGRRHGRRGRASPATRPPIASACPPTAASTCGAGATPPTPSTSPSTPTCGGRRRWRRAFASGARAAPASASTTSPTSTSTPASRRRCTSPRDALGLDPADDGAAVTVTGGLPFAGGAASDYLSHTHRHDGRRAARRPGLARARVAASACT